MYAPGACLRKGTIRKGTIRPKFYQFEKGHYKTQVLLFWMYKMMQNAISCLLLGIHVHMASSVLGIHIYMASSVLGIHIIYMASSVLVRNTAVFTLVYTSTWPPQFWCGKQLSLPWCTHLPGHLSSGAENSWLHLGVHIYLATSVLVQKTAVFTLVYTSTWPTLFWCGKQLSSPWDTQLPGQLCSGAENSCLHLGIHIYVANSVLGIHIYMASSVLGIHIYLASSVLGIHIYLASSVLGIHIYLASCSWYTYLPGQLSSWYTHLPGQLS